MNPIVKYRGGKSREIRYFNQYIPDTFNRYLEPFLGGGAVFFHLEPERAVINDVNERLVNFYRQVRDQFEALSGELSVLQKTYEENQSRYESLKKEHPDERAENGNEALYYELRDMFNGLKKPEYMDGTLYYFINKTAYSGMIRYNRRGEYNVPFGRYRHLNTELVSLLHSRLLNRAQLLCGDYARVFEMAQNDDFMFLDPPYDCIFNDYGNTEMQNGFDEGEHRRLAADFRNLNCRALMVIGKTELTEELYAGQIVSEYYKNYAVNIRNRFHTDATHILVANYDADNCGSVNVQPSMPRCQNRA